jgi:hypothetical protein
MYSDSEILHFYNKLNQNLKSKLPNSLSLKSCFIQFSFPDWDKDICINNIACEIETNYLKRYEDFLKDDRSYYSFAKWFINEANDKQVKGLFSDLNLHVNPLFFWQNHKLKVNYSNYEKVNLNRAFEINNSNFSDCEEFNTTYFNEINQVSDNLIVLIEPCSIGENSLFDYNGNDLGDLIRHKIYEMDEYDDDDYDLDDFDEDEEYSQDSNNGDFLTFSILDQNLIKVHQWGNQYYDGYMYYLFEWIDNDVEFIKIINDDDYVNPLKYKQAAKEVTILFSSDLNRKNPH